MDIFECDAKMMSKLWVVVFVMLFFALFCAIYPLLKGTHTSRMPMLIIFLSAIGFSFFSILFFQKVGAINQYRLAEMIQQLQSHLTKDPNHSKGWYLLGCLYQSERDDANARVAFSNAKRLCLRRTVAIGTSNLYRERDNILIKQTLKIPIFK